MSCMSGPTAPADFWKEFPDLLAGKDLQAKRTWLGITKRGKLLPLPTVTMQRLLIVLHKRILVEKLLSII